MSKSENAMLESDLAMDQPSQVLLHQACSEEYDQLQKRVLFLTAVLSAIAVAIAGIFFGFYTSISLLIGALSGLLYFRLLARSIGKLGKTSKTVGKVQMAVPVLLVVLTSRFSSLELLPSILGFLLYKPSLVIQAYFDSSK